MDNNQSNTSNLSERNPLISELLTRYIDYLCVEKNRLPLTLERYKRHLEEFIRLVGDRPVKSITSESISLYRRCMLDAGLSPATIAVCVTIIRGFLRYTRDIFEINVYAPEKILRPKVPVREVEYLTKEELTKFLEAIPIHNRSGLRHRALAEVLYATGMRISEAVALNREQMTGRAVRLRLSGKEINNDEYTLQSDPFIGSAGILRRDMTNIPPFL